MMVVKPDEWTYKWLNLEWVASLASKMLIFLSRVLGFEC